MKKDESTRILFGHQLSPQQTRVAINFTYYEVDFI